MLRFCNNLFFSNPSCIRMYLCLNKSVYNFIHDICFLIPNLKKQRLGTCVKLCMAELDFFLLPKLGKWTKIGPKTEFFEFIEKLVISCYWVYSIMKIILFFVFLHKSHIWKHFCSWDLGQNVLSQLDCRIL